MLCARCCTCCCQTQKLFTEASNRASNGQFFCQRQSYFKTIITEGQTWLMVEGYQSQRPTEFPSDNQHHKCWTPVITCTTSEWHKIKRYIEIIKCVIDSYLDKALEPLERIEKSWYASFLLRYWRKWIMLNNSYTLSNNFVTLNAFSSIELNDHAMVNFMRTIRDHAHNNSCFVPWLLGSQTCEETFRAVRSMSRAFFNSY